MARFIELNRPFVHEHNYRTAREREKEKKFIRDRLSTKRTKRFRLSCFEMNFKVNTRVKDKDRKAIEINILKSG